MRSMEWCTQENLLNSLRAYAPRTEEYPQE